MRTVPGEELQFRHRRPCRRRYHRQCHHQYRRLCRLRSNRLCNCHSRSRAGRFQQVHCWMQDHYPASTSSPCSWFRFRSPDYHPCKPERRSMRLRMCHPWVYRRRPSFHRRCCRHRPCCHHHPCCRLRKTLRSGTTGWRWLDSIQCLCSQSDLPTRRSSHRCMKQQYQRYRTHPASTPPPARCQPHKAPPSQPMQTPRVCARHCLSSQLAPLKVPKEGELDLNRAGNIAQCAPDATFRVYRHDTNRDFRRCPELGSNHVHE